MRSRLRHSRKHESSRGLRRIGRAERASPENKVIVELDLDGTGAADIETGVAFFDFALMRLASHANFDLTVHVLGNVAYQSINSIVTDTVGALGEAFRQGLLSCPEIRRFGEATVPVAEALATVVVDVAGPPFLRHDEPLVMESVAIAGCFPGTLIQHVWQLFTHYAAITMHVVVSSGRDAHHIAEAQFVAVGRALRVAVEHVAPTGEKSSMEGRL